MNRPLKTTSRPQLALQSYLDSLLQEVTEELTLPIEAVAEEIAAEAVLDEFQAAVLEEQARDAATAVTAAPVQASVAPAFKASVIEVPAAVMSPVSTIAPLLQALLPPAVEVQAAPEPAVVEVHQALVLPVVEVHLPPSNTPPPVDTDGRPSWAAEPFECLLFDVAGLTLAVPLVCLGSIYSLAGHELTPLFGQPEWFLGILPSQAGNLKVLDTCLLYTSPSPRDGLLSRMPSSA